MTIFLRTGQCKKCEPNIKKHTVHKSLSIKVGTILIRYRTLISSKILNKEEMATYINLCMGSNNILAMLEIRLYGEMVDTIIKRFHLRMWTCHFVGLLNKSNMGRNILWIETSTILLWKKHIHLTIIKFKLNKILCSNSLFYIKEKIWTWQHKVIPILYLTSKFCS